MATGRLQAKVKTTSSPTVGRLQSKIKIDNTPLPEKQLGTGATMPSSIPSPKTSLPAPKAVTNFFAPKPLAPIRARDIVREIPAQLKDMFAPGFGFKEEEIMTAKPTAIDIVKNVPRVAVNIASGVAGLADLATSKIGLPKKVNETIAESKKTPIGRLAMKAGEALEDFSIPKTAKDVAAFRTVDLGSNFIGMGSIKVGRVGLEQIAKSDNANYISKVLMREVPNLTKDQADVLAKPLVYVDNIPDTERALNRIDLAVNKAKTAETRVTDPAQIQEIRNSIEEGQLTLRTGEFNGRVLNKEELLAVRRSVENDLKKIGESRLSNVPKYEVEDVTPAGFGPSTPEAPVGRLQAQKTPISDEIKLSKTVDQFIQEKNPIPDGGFIGRKHMEEWGAKTDELRRIYAGKEVFTPEQLKEGLSKLPKEIEYQGNKYIPGGIVEVKDSTTGKLKRVSFNLISPKLGVKDVQLSGDELLDFYSQITKKDTYGMNGGDIGFTSKAEKSRQKGIDSYMEANRRLDNYVGPKPTPPVSNRSLNETNTAKVVADTISGKREDFRLTNEKQLTQAKAYKAITDKATPETSITVFRVAPKGSSIKAGDHIATTEKSLDKYLNNRSDSEVIKAEVKVKDLVKSDGLGDEFVYSPESFNSVVKGGEAVDLMKTLNGLKSILPKFNNGDEFAKAYKVASRFGRLAPGDGPGKFVDQVNSIVKAGADSLNFKAIGKVTGDYFTDEFGKDFFDQWKSQKSELYNKTTKNPSPQFLPKKELSMADKLIAQGKIRVVSREGKDVYQYRNKNDIWKNAPNEAVAVARTAGTKKLLLPKKNDIQNLPENLQEEDYLISLEEDALMDSPYSNPNNRFFVDNEGRVRELGDVKSPKLIRIMEDTMAQAGIKDPTEFAEGLEKYFKQKQKLEIRKKQFRLDKEKVKLTTSLAERKEIPPIEKSEAEVRTLEKIANQQLEKSIPEAESLSNIIQQTKTDVKKKVNILDYIRTPDRILQKIGFAEEGKLLRQQYEAYLKELPKNIDKITAWSKQVPKASNERIFKYLDGQAINLTDAEKTVALEIKAWLKEWATRLKLPESNQISDYITRLFDEELFGKEFSDDLAKLITDRLPGSVYNPFLEKRLGAKGYKQDTWQALDAYVKRSTRKVHMDEALLKIQEKAGSTLEMSNIESSQFKYLQRYINNINLRPTELDNLIDNSVKSVIGYKLGQRPVTRVTRLLRQMTYRGMLGLNPGSALRNLSQGINTYAVLGEKYTAIGYTKLLNPGSIKELKEEGVLGQHFIQDRAYNATKKNIERFDKVLFSFFETAERINRGSAYFGAKSKALAEGKTEAEAVTYAKSIVRKTQFAFGSIDTPVALQNDILKTLFQFQTFTTKQIEFLTEMLKDKNFVGLLRYAVAGLAFVYTIGQAFGMEPREILPIYRVGVPPSLKFPWELGKAIVNAPDKYGNQPDLEKKVSNVGKAMIGLIPAGTQAKKTIEGLKAIQEGGSYDKGGNLQFTQGLSMAEKLQAILFGKYASNEAKEYFNKADVSKKEKAQIKPVYDQVQALAADGKEDEALDIINGLSDADYEVYKKYKTQIKKERTAELKKDVLPQFLKVQQLKDEEKIDEAQAIVDGLTDEEYEVYEKVKKDFEKEGALKLDDEKTVVDETTLMESIVMVAKGLAVDPKVALQIILTKEKIRRIDNRTIIMERMTLEESQKIKTENNANNSDWKLDHIIPLQLGGDNSGDNLKLVPTATWEKYTDYENELGRKLRAGTITKKEAQKLITEFKNSVDNQQ